MHLPPADSELVQIMDAALADAASRAGSWLVCRPGCTPCCHGAFAINALDAARLRAEMDRLRLADPARAHALEQRAHAWLAAHGADFPGDLDTGRLGESEAEQEAFEEFANDAACPALDPATGRCDVYAGRPMTCRVFGPPVRIHPPCPAPGTDSLAGGDSGEIALQGDSALGCCELCFAGATAEQIADCEMVVPHGLEESLLAEGRTEGQTVVAFALIKPAS